MEAQAQHQTTLGDGTIMAHLRLAGGALRRALHVKVWIKDEDVFLVEPVEPVPSTKKIPAFSEAELGSSRRDLPAITELSPSLL